MKRIKNYLIRQLNRLIDFLSRHRWIVVVGVVLFSLLLVCWFAIELTTYYSVVSYLLLDKFPYYFQIDGNLEFYFEAVSLNFSALILSELAFGIFLVGCKILSSVVGKFFPTKRKSKSDKPPRTRL